MGDPKYKYQDFFNELAAGRAYGIFVDDTGAPGSIRHNTKLPSRTKILCCRYRSTAPNARSY